MKEISREGILRMVGLAGSGSRRGGISSILDELEEQFQADALNITNYVRQLNNALRGFEAEEAEKWGTYAIWKEETDREVTTIAAHWDENDQLIGYSTTTQTAEMISSAVVGLATKTELQAATNQLSGLISRAQTTADAAATSAAASATWIGQNSQMIATIVGQFNQDGTLKYYSTTTQTATSITAAINANNATRKALDDPTGWEQGRWKASGGGVVGEDSNYYVRYRHSIDVSSLTLFYINTAYTLTVYFVTSSSAYISNTTVGGSSSGALAITIPGNAARAYIHVGSSHSATVSVSEVTSFGLIYTENNIVTSASISMYIQNELSWLVAQANIIVFNFTTAFQIQANGTAVFDLDTSGNLKITGKLTENSVIDSLVTLDTQKMGASLLNFKDASYVLTQSGTYLYTAYLHVIKRTTYNGKKSVYLPTLGQCRQMIGIAETDKREFCFEITVINQATSTSEAEYASTDPNNVYIVGGTHAYYRTTHDTSIRPRILRQTTSENEFNIQRGQVATIFIAYSKWVTRDQQGYADADGTFIASYLLG